jgi:MFS family permease
MRASAYRRYLLAILLIVLVFNKVEHITVVLLLQSIKTDLLLSDAQLGLLTGIAFTLFYSLMGIPIARWADRGNRIAIISIATALQCGALVLSGLAANFAQLLAFRAGVAVGEAGCVPPAHSLIADYFNRVERPRAVSRYLLGYPLSALFGYFLAGRLNELYGWRWTFIVVGLPGLVLSVIVRLTLREPRRENSRPVSAGASIAGSHPSPSIVTDFQPPQLDLKEVFISLWGNVSFRHLLINYALTSFFGVGIFVWAPTFFVRSHDLTSGELGMWFAAIYGLGGLLGTWCGGELACRFATRNEPLQLRIIAIVCVGFGVVSAGVYLSPHLNAAFALLAVAIVGYYATIGPLFATVQTLVPERMRAMAFASIYLFANLIGTGLGPLITGEMSDALQPAFGSESLRYTLLATCPGFIWAAWHLWRASQTVTRDLEARQRAEDYANEASARSSDPRMRLRTRASNDRARRKLR